MKRAAATISLAVLCFMALQTAHAQNIKDPRLWIDRMSTAMDQMSYQGTFVYIHDDRMETMRITHVSDEQGVRERLVSLSGSKVEVLRDSGGVRWVRGDKGSVLADSGGGRAFFPELPMDRIAAAQPYYNVLFGGDTRIAGQEAKNIKVIPHDHYRYGYSLWLEKRSGLLLKWELIDSRRRSLAKLMFTDIRLGAEVDRGELEPAGGLEKMKTVKSELPEGSPVPSRRPSCSPAELPPGFELVSQRFDSKPEGGGGTFEHLVYSDGLAAVSVYLEHHSGGSAHWEGVHRQGTSHAWSGVSSDKTVTVVGNVPAVTVEMIGRSVETVSH